MLNKIQILICDELISLVDWYTKSHLITTANTVILYANELIDEYYLSNNIWPSLSKKSSLSSDNIIPIPEVTFTDNINPHTIKKGTAIPKSTIKD